MNSALAPYAFGLLAVIVIYLLSRAVTGSWSPIALARGNNRQTSTSLLQNLVFTVVTIFAYVTVVAARCIARQPSEPLPPLPTLPINLLIMMGFSFATSTGSKYIAISNIQKRLTTTEDNSNVVSNRDGDVDLIKVQMLIWTFVAAAIYVVMLVAFVSAKCYLDTIAAAACPNGAALPDIDGSLLVLMGLSEGGYVAGKLVSRTAAAPRIEHLLPAKAKPKEQVSILGMFFGESKEGNSIILKNSSGDEYAVPSDSVLEWGDTKIRFDVPDTLPLGGYTLRVNSNGQTGESKDFTIASAQPNSPP